MLLISNAASAQANATPNQVLVVPYNAENPRLPHPAHEQAPITLKAMVRNATCGGNYRVRWDTDRDGSFDDEAEYTFTRNATTKNIWDIGRTFRVPNVDRDGALNITVRLQVPCAAEGNPANHYKFGTFRLFVYDFTPGGPDTWTAEQLEIMNIMAVQESMWYGHRLMDEFGGDHTTSQLYGQISVRRNEQWGGGMINAWIMALNGHLGAYPPGTINWYNLPRDQAWEAANERRWNTDPYAETIARYLNGTIRADSRAVGIVAGKEDNTCGYDANRNVIRCNRADGNAGDQVGAWIGNADGGPHSNGVEDPASYLMGLYLASSAIMTPAFAGTPVQVGHASVIGRPFEWLIQSQVDLTAEQQMYRGYGEGGWYYHRYTGTDGNYSDMSVTQWAMIGLEAAEKAGGFAGVVVPNNVKYRSVINSYNNTRNADGGGRYRTTESRTCTSLMLTGGCLLGERWVGVHNMARNNTVPFPNETNLTQANLVDDYNRAIAYTKNYWYSNNKIHCGGRQDRFWDRGDYKCGDNNSAYGGGRCGSTYTLYSHQKGYRTGEPELTFDDRDWLRQFATYYIRAQDRAMNDASGRDGNYGVFGRIYDSFCAQSSITCNYMAPAMMSGMGGLILTPTIFNPKPVAIASVQPDQVVEGCVGGNAGEVVFHHEESFHPGSDQTIVAYQWDVDASNGLWWDTNAQADFESDNEQPFEHRYNSSGNYVATLRVVDNLGQSKTTVVRVTVDAAANVPPSVAHGGPYVIEVGQNLQLAGRATDQNIPCGDQLTIAWDLDNDGQYDDANGATPNVGWAALQGLAQNQPHRVAIQVRDRAGQVARAETTLTIYPREPVASGRANPNPAACQQQVTFDGSASSHPNPNRAVAQYDWDIDGDGAFDGSGAIFRSDYDRFGTYDVTLRVTDDLGRTDTDQFQVVVDQGNTPPVARVASNEINLLEEDNLVLDGRPSSDADLPCGDSIVSYQWDLDGDGQFDDANGANPTVAWAQVQNLLDWPADRETGLPANTVRLRVTDGFGASSTADVIVRVYRANPVALVVQVPLPSPIRIDTGFSSTTLDGRQSYSTVPGVNIVRYDWDLDDNGTFETADRPTTEFRKVFDPIPLPPRVIPDTFIRLRVTDANDRTDVIRYQVVYDIPPTPPTADADPTDPPERGYHILVGEGLTLDGSQSFDPDADEGDYIEFYRWDLTYNANDGFNADVSAQAANQAEQDQAAASDLAWADLNAAGINGPGNYTVRLQVEDTTRLTAEDDAVLNVYARDPVARVDANPNPAACGGRVTFDGTASAHPHPTIDIVGYAWDFNGDGNPDAAGASVQRAFNQFTFGVPNNVSLTVTDSRGNTGTATVQVNVTEGNRAPVAQAGGFRDGGGRVVGPYAIAVGEGLRLDAAGSSDPDAACGDRIQRYQWDLRNDGSFEGGGAQLNLTWAQLNAAGINAPGQYDVRLRVTDRFNVTSDGLATLVVVGGPDADAQANPNRAGCEQRVEFTAAGSRFFGPADQGFAIVAYDWDLDGDGQFD
ncbi:MAG: PKD domain-containing protein, partial [Myxococcales bacterium]|nr:PKD domain-containing protein [Myxococcales bacterium]